MQHKFFVLVGIVSAAMVLIVLFFIQTAGAPGSGATASSTLQSASSTAEGADGPRQAPPGFSEYHNTLYHFSLFFPQDMTAREYTEPGTAMTIMFGGLLGSHEFQIFVVPYGEQKITAERFRLDVPSGIMASSTDKTLDGVAATSFYVSNQTLADTYEVWFIYHGFLYEVTTYKEFGPWLDEIMQGWKFL